MKIKKCNIPSNSLLQKYLPADYNDAYTCTTKLKDGTSADDLQIAFWTVKPKWIDFLFNLRNWLVKPFGLKNEDDRNTEKLIEALKQGGSYGIISVPNKSEKETVLLLTDKHLNAYISIQIEKVNNEQKIVTASTLVYFHNTLGRLYFFVICPFHHIVVKYMIKFTLKQFVK